MDATHTADRQPRHIAIVIPGLHGGGAEFAARQWITELRRQGRLVTVYVHGRQQPDVKLPPGTAVHSFPPRRGGLRINGPLRLALIPIWLRQAVRRDQPDVVFSLMTFSNVITLLALKVSAKQTVPVMVSERNVQVLQAENVRRRDRLTIWLARHLYARAEGALAISHPVASELVSAFRVPAKRLFVVPNPVVPSPLATPTLARPDRLHLVLVARQAKQKRPDLFLAVLRELASRGIAVRGTVIGDGPLRESAELESSRLGIDVAFLGWREPWWDAVSDVDCLVLTANAEGFANVLVEAAAAGIPSVASSRALGVADAIVPGITGQFATADNPQAYADAVLEAAPLCRAPAVNIRSWLQHFSMTNSTETLLTALRATIDGQLDHTLP